MPCIFKANNKIFCFLDNPKCASETMRTRIYPQFRKKYKLLFYSKKPIKYVKKNNLALINWNHCPLEIVVKWLKKNNHDPNKAVFITTLRNPMDRVILHFYWLLKNKKQPIKPDINAFIETIPEYYPTNFRVYQDFKVTELIKIENLKENLTSCFMKHNLNINLSKLKVTNKGIKTLDISDQLTLDFKKKIYDLYHIDYIEGNYPSPI